MNAALSRRLQRLEAAQRPSQSRHIVISDRGEDGGFYAEHGRFMTTAEMDAAEAELRASGTARPGDTVRRIVHRIIDPPRRDLVCRHLDDLCSAAALQ